MTAAADKAGNLIARMAMPFPLCGNAPSRKAEYLNGWEWLRWASGYLENPIEVFKGCVHVAPLQEDDVTKMADLCVSTASSSTSPNEIVPVRSGTVA